MESEPPSADKKEYAEKILALACGNAGSGNSEKELCDAIIYEMLSIEDPKKYPRPGESLPYSITPNGGACIISEGDPEPYSSTIKECDCSDPKNYDFYDKGMF